MASQGVAMLRGMDAGFISLGVGLLGVVLARWVFVNREQRRLGRRESWRETLPLTLVAMLISAVIIWDRKMGLSSSAFVGLGVGWATVLLLEIAGVRIQQFIQAMLGAAPPPAFNPRADMSGNDGRVLPGDADPTPAMDAALHQLDRIEGNPKP